MMHVVKSSYYSFLIAMLLAFNTPQVSGQEKFNLTAGFGFTELLNIGIKYQINQTQLGLSLGTMPLGNDDNLISISFDSYHHFGGTSELTQIKPRYFRIGIVYLKEENKSAIHNNVFLNIRYGRDANISKKFGVQMDIGLAFGLYNEEVRKIPPNPSGGFNFNFNIPRIWPTLGLNLFYRI